MEILRGSEAITPFCKEFKKKEKRNKKCLKKEPLQTTAVLLLIGLGGKLVKRKRFFIISPFLNCLHFILFVVLRFKYLNVNWFTNCAYMRIFSIKL